MNSLEINAKESLELLEIILQFLGKLEAKSSLVRIIASSLIFRFEITFLLKIRVIFVFELFSIVEKPSTKISPLPTSLSLVIFTICDNGYEFKIVIIRFKKRRPVQMITMLFCRLFS